MKALKILGIALVAIMLCGPVMGQSKREIKKQIANEKLKQELIKAQMETENATITSAPCAKAAFDDKDFYRGMGVGDNVNEQNSRDAAFEAAKASIKAKMPEFVHGVTSQYLNVYGGSAPSEDVQRKMERMFNGVIEGMLNDARTVCDNYKMTDRGTYHYYVAIEIPKAEIKKNVTEALSKDEKLGIDFNAAQFQKFMDERMDAMLEAKKNAGY